MQLRILQGWYSIKNRNKMLSGKVTVLRYKGNSLEMTLIMMI